MSDEPTTLENRSEIVFLYDASDCNPNGNPLSANDKPRVDETTGEAVVTDVRLKRYIRDQLDDDGYGIYVRNPSKAPYEDVPDRDGLFKRVTGTDEDELEDMASKDAAELFLTNATDVRYFGATCSFSSNFQDLLGDDFPGQFIGPVQFEHGRSMHTVATKTESKQLSTVVASGGEEEQGTFATDNRLEYALVKFHGVVNENAAEATHLTQDDVERLDRLCWRGLKNQTLTRSKMGHQPRVYLRVEYETDSYHSGSLDHGVELDTDDKTDTELRNIRDCTLDVSGLLDELENDADHIETVHVIADDYVQFDFAGNDGPEAFYEKLRSRVGEDNVTVIDVHPDQE
ncbi:type I-B CRISPR-associated protein Cas7/Csh2 [Halapricum desulfuricans]|uniref:CRISPR-Cas system related protein Cas7, RAMP superfamily n=1 Tax=Halapricum desulfuricans TaxID=2841257 RepID=A0A897N193_9EURY|nr:type I-B CRISPR-associated protein Cas7/Csh2 [Halapricum desulfuricans]QSG06008.1 CRISPR-Cas system related protein Cas7, RAMP superfamily [Halapricum desulfuricans]